MRRTSARLQYGVCLVLFLLTVGCYASGAEKPSPDFIAASVLDQESACQGSLQVCYTVTGHPADGGPVPIFSIKYVRTPQTVYMEDSILTKDGKPEPRMKKYSYNRATKIIKSVMVQDGKERNWSIFQGQPGQMPARVTVLYSPDPLYMLTVPIEQAIRSGSIGDTMELIDGHECWRIDVPGPAIGHSKSLAFAVWADPAVGFLPRQIERFSKGLVVSSISFRDYRQLDDGVWFPFVVSMPGVDGDGTVECNVQSARVGDPVSPAEIEITFEPGTEVWDRDLKLYRTVQ